MGDLISRVVYKSKLLKELGVLNKEYRKAILNGDNDLILAIQNQQSAYMIALRLLDNLPTAYSVDKVVKELEENASRYTKKYTTPYGNNGYKDTKAVSVHKAIEIVKQGGVDDDVCEWKFANDGEFIQNPHTKRLYSNEPSMKNVYCNTCGKKIEVVE